MMSRKLFGTDGVRGLVNAWPMTPEIALQLGQAAALVFRKLSPGRGVLKMIIGKDTRLSGYMIEQALAAGICSMGGDVYLVGPLPTPGIAFLTASMRADAGVVISGSHNSFEDNGIKFFCHRGFKLPDEVELEMENLVFSGEMESQRPAGKSVGRAHRIDDAIGRYIVFLKNTFPADLTLDGMKIVLDCAHGAGYKVAPSVLEELGAEVIRLGTSPNGENINLQCGSLHPKSMQEKVREHGADLGIALDGDADRVIFCDEKGEVVDGDRILFMTALLMKESQTLKKNTLVATIMSNMGLEVGLKNLGISLVRTAVGDRYVVEEMRKQGFNLGGEQSGHIVLLDHATTGDGLLAALQVLAHMRRKEKNLSELASQMEIFPQELINVKVREKPDLMGLKPVAKAVRHAEEILKQQGRVVLRYSGTESLARVMVEGPQSLEVKTLAQDIAQAVKVEIGA